MGRGEDAARTSFNKNEIRERAKTIIICVRSFKASER